MEKLEVAACAT